jgi:hypothetical protein
MRQRCNDPKSAHYPRYGGRGITICARWNSFDAFYADMGPRPAGHTLERMNRDLPYSPGNCIWATGKEQANNTSANRQMTHLGHTKTMAEWCDELALPYSTVRGRLRRGWSDEAALTTPVRAIDSRRGNPLLMTYQGRTQSMSAWCKELGLSPSTVCCRLKRGCTTAEALAPPPVPASAKA